MTNINGIMFIELCIDLRVVFIDPPADFGIYKELRALKNTSRHHIEFRAMIQKRININFVVEGNFCTSGGTCIQLLEMIGVDDDVENRRRHIYGINDRRNNRGSINRYTIFASLIVQV